MIGTSVDELYKMWVQQDLLALSHPGIRMNSKCYPDLALFFGPLTIRGFHLECCPCTERASSSALNPGCYHEGLSALELQWLSLLVSQVQSWSSTCHWWCWWILHRWWLQGSRARFPYMPKQWKIQQRSISPLRLPLSRNLDGQNIMQGCMFQGSERSPTLYLKFTYFLQLCSVIYSKHFAFVNVACSVCKGGVPSMVNEEKKYNFQCNRGTHPGPNNVVKW